jgi:Zn-dependent M16 (insulinase) family peptidase
MNAFTSSDWTAYPFASKNRKDFDNLLSVYLDAVFFSRLDPLDFAQEGHRLEFEEADNPSSPLVYKGVVYNEMKGAMSSAVSVLYDTLGKYLFPTNTYHHNSGGDPEVIVDLTYPQLKAFYQTHYHPSNAVFMTYGDIAAHEHQRAFHERALCHFAALDKEFRVKPEQRYFAPLNVQAAYAAELHEGESLDNKTHIVMAWLLGQSTNLEAQLKAHLLSDVLLENSASPLRQLLETCGLGSAPSPLCGLEDSHLEMSFMCGIEGSSPSHAQTLQNRIIALLEKLADEGVAQERLEAVLHQLELSQREIGGDHYPFGLQMILSGLSCALHRGDPIALLNLDPVLVKLRAAIQEPDFIKTLIRDLLLNNMHRVCIVLTPDEHLEARREQAIRAQLDAQQARLSDTEKQHLVERAKALLARQAHVDDESILPKVGLVDVPPAKAMPIEIVKHTKAGQLTSYLQGTNGLVYQQVAHQLPELPDQHLPLLPILTHLVGEVGAGSDDYLQIQDRLSACTGGVSAFTSLRGRIDDEQQVKGYWFVSGKALNRNAAPLTDLIHQLSTQMRFDELERIRELVSQFRARVDQGITGNGHSLAMTAACSAMNPAAQLAHQLSGLAGIQSIQKLDHAIQSPSQLEALADQLTELHGLIMNGTQQFLLVGEDAVLPDCEKHLTERWSAVQDSTMAKTFAPIRAQIHQAWLTNTQVNFCAKAYPTVSSDHPDAATLAVLSGFLRNGFLHRAIREQGGAYGGGANQDSNIAAFRFYSYRDPRCTETLQDFDKSITWLLSQSHGYQALEEAILGVIGSLDKPGSPAGEAKLAFQNRLFGRDDAFQARFRERVLATTIADLQRVGQLYFNPDRASVAIITAKSHWETLKLPGYTVEQV